MLRELYYGKFNPCERKNRAIEKQDEIIKKIADEEKFFIDKMSPEDCERFHKLSELYSELFGLEEAEIFTYGATMGALLMKEIMDVAKTMKFE